MFVRTAAECKVVLALRAALWLLGSTPMAGTVQLPEHDPRNFRSTMFANLDTWHQDFNASSPHMANKLPATSRFLPGISHASSSDPSSTNAAPHDLSITAGLSFTRFPHFAHKNLQHRVPHTGGTLALERLATQDAFGQVAPWAAMWLAALGPGKAASRSIPLVAGEGRSLHQISAEGHPAQGHPAVLSADLQQNLVYASEVPSAKAVTSSWGILIVLAVIGTLWMLELLLTKRFDEKMLEHADQKKNPDRPHWLAALGAARYLMSWHVVLGNFYSPGGMTDFSSGNQWYSFASWAALAAPWFFAVSGFSHTYAKLVGLCADVQEDWFYGMLQRIAPWYPFALISLVCCAIRSRSAQAEDWADFMANVLLIHGFIWDGTRFPYMLGDWWLSFLALYLIFFSPLYQAIRDAPNSLLWTVFFIAILCAVPIAIFDWIWRMQDRGHRSTARGPCVGETPGARVDGPYVLALLRVWPGAGSLVREALHEKGGFARAGGTHLCDEANA